MSRFCHCKQSAWTMKQGRVSELSKVIVCKPSRELLYETEFDIWAGFGPVGRTETFCNFAKVSHFWGCFFHHFFGESKKPKNPFKTNWPLIKIAHHMTYMYGLFSWGVYLQYSTAADDGHPSWGSSVIQSVIIFLWHWGNRMVFFFFTF